MSEVKRYVLLDQAEDVGIEASYINAPTLVVKASDHDALAARLAAAENGFNNACHRIRELEAENARLDMEMTAYRQDLTPKDAEAMRAVIDALYVEKKARAALAPKEPT